MDQLPWAALQNGQQNKFLNEKNCFMLNKAEINVPNERKFNNDCDVLKFIIPVRDGHCDYLTHVRNPNYTTCGC